MSPCIIDLQDTVVNIDGSLVVTLQILLKEENGLTSQKNPKEAKRNFKKKS